MKKRKSMGKIHNFNLVNFHSDFKIIVDVFAKKAINHLRNNEGGGEPNASMCNGLKTVKT